MDNENSSKKLIIIGCICALGSEVLYGLSYIFTKQATDGATPLALLGWRFLLAFVVYNVLVLTRVVKVHFKGKNIKPLFLVALFCPIIYFICETFGIKLTTASESGVFIACIPVVSIIFSAIFLKKKPTILQIIGITGSLIGVILTVVAVGGGTSFSAGGYICLLLAVVSYAVYEILVDKVNGFSGAEITYVMLLSACVVFLIASLVEGGVNGNVKEILGLPFHNTKFLVAILYSGIGCSIGAFFMSNVAIATIGVNRYSSFTGIATVVSIVSGALILKETFTTLQIVGAVIIIVGVYIANIKFNHKKNIEEISNQ